MIIGTMRDLCEALEDDDVGRPVENATALLRIAKEIGYAEECENGPTITKRGSTFLKRVRKGA